MCYSCEYQNEIQSALWSRQSVNLLTVAVFVKGGGCKSYLVVTNSQDKGKDTVRSGLLAVLKDLTEKEIDLGNSYYYFYKWAFI